MAEQRIRVEFAKGERVRFISHLDVLRYWERVIRRAELPLAYSQGFTPHPRITFAAPLPLGFTSTGEIMDFQLEERAPMNAIQAAVEGQQSPEMGGFRFREVAMHAPALQAVLTHADYRVVLAGIDPGALQDEVERFLALEALEWTETKKERERVYDLRAGVSSAQAYPIDGAGAALDVRLAAHQDFTVRPEQIIEALAPGVEAVSFERRRLLLKSQSSALLAWKRRGQYLDERPR